jgi:hypothetical protein
MPETVAEAGGSDKITVDTIVLLRAVPEGDPAQQRVAVEC